MTDLVRLSDLIETEASALGFELVRVKMMPSEAGDGGEALQIMAEDPATGQLIMGCGQSILGIVSMVLLIIFIVTITRSRGALLKLRHEDANPAPSTPPAVPPGV